MQKQEGLFS